MTSGLKKYSKKLCVLVLALIMASCYQAPYGYDDTAVFLDEVHSSLPPSPIFSRTPDAIMLCRSHQCVATNKLNNREFIFNTLWYFFDTNVYSTVLLCEADEIHHKCYDNFISYPVKAGITPGNIFVDSADLSDVRLLRAEQKIELIIGYKYYFNGITPSCRPSKTVISVNSPDQIIMEDATGHECRLTTVGSSVMTTVYSVDFIDLDYGLIGAHYSIGASGTAYGGKVGYILMRFVKDGLSRNKMFKADRNLNYVTQPKECDETGTATCALCPEEAPYWRDGFCRPCNAKKGLSQFCKADGHYCGTDYECVECETIGTNTCPLCPKDAPYWRNGECKPCYENTGGTSDFCHKEGNACNKNYDCVNCDITGTKTCPLCPKDAPYWRNGFCRPCHSARGTSDFCKSAGRNCNSNYECSECDRNDTATCPSCPENMPYWRNGACRPCHSPMGVSDHCLREGYQCNGNFECSECDTRGGAICASCPEYLPYWRNNACKPCHSIGYSSMLCLNPNVCDQNFNCIPHEKAPRQLMPQKVKPKEVLPPGKVLFMPVPEPKITGSEPLVDDETNEPDSGFVTTPVVNPDDATFINNDSSAGSDVYNTTGANNSGTAATEQTNGKTSTMETDKNQAQPSE
ncbi:MAG: hypothetical protein AB7U85_08655 [Alphaproteobacteria bacterium]